jgi:hypothetical protein
MVAGFPMQPQSVAAGSTSILIVTYAKDMDFLRYCLKSIAQNASGFQEVVVAVPSTERGLYDWVKRTARMVYFDEVPGKGMLSHMAMKCRADELSDRAVHLAPRRGLRGVAEGYARRPVSGRQAGPAARAVCGPAEREPARVAEERGERAGVQAGV